ncbi:UPF0182 family membrane protein [Marinitenerispora sediminis]|uniref:UPF0182 protein DEF24_10895 n=1 Tax=Marinitenerispora sediminis TaxID=1931232 RepID=A0A368T682_9ACTN|nr:UPF0182 family protein [Marinitenerispora sediminis]RCV50503.1 hypothetical protein DEF28_17920 [Marinitenerispora sediminis]RCV55484.1 hypothetical protein DEF23_14210 [Marinitenerispora sediminis]RCV59116.1 hypothetical protein DEF24_10895 [Marinitenerispora sediminis]
MPRRSRLLAPVAAAVVVIIAGIMLAANFWTDYKWFDSVGYTSVFLTELRTRALLFAGAGLVMALVVGSSIYFAYRTRPLNRPLSLEQEGLDRYRSSVDPHRKLFFWGIVGVLALLTGASASGEWQTYLRFANSTEFGTEDPQFHIDVSFFTFVYPFLRALLGYLFTAVVIAFIAAVIVHYLYGGVRLQSHGQRATPAARVHLSVLLGVFVLLKAAAYWLDQYGLVFSNRGYTTGASYTDVNAVLYAKIILAIIAVVCAGLFFANIYFKNAMVPMVSLGLLVLSAVLVGGLYPAIVQQFTVRPNEQRLEEPYIQRNIEATRDAYGIADAEVTTYDAQTELTPQQLSQEASTIPSVRLVDPSVVSQTFQQMQQVRGFYQFPEVLDVDRYQNADGESVDTIIAMRELSGPPEGQDNWLTRHLVYTHGFGIVAAAGNQVDAEGRPVFTEYNIPPTGELSAETGDYEPRIYFGREGADYVIVNAEPEYDYPLDAEAGDVPTSEDAATPTASPEADNAQAPADGQTEQEAGQEGGAGGQSPAPEEEGDGAASANDSGQATNHYDGDGGVQLSNFFDRILYAVKYQEPDILLNSAINSESQIIYERDPAERVEKVAPFLTVDGKPYPAVVDGRIVWIVDAYTTSDGYPYATSIDLANATTDTFTEGTDAVNALPGNRVNYIRNSVKATVDAYDGTVTLYGWDEEDPVLQTWSQAFPGVVTSREDISDELMSHLRYPDDLFKVQREILKRYHITDANAFYGGQDFWNVPVDPTKEGESPEPPYRQTLRYPGDDDASFSLTSTFVPRGRENLAAFMAVDSDPASEEYGRLRLLELPRSTVILGPGQVQNAFQSDAGVREVLLPLEQSSARVTYGNLLTLPFAGGLLYVEPLYVQAGGSDQASYPLLQQVMVGFGEEVAIGRNLQEALNNLFEGGETPLPEEGGASDDEGQQDAAPSGDLASALRDAADAYDAGQEALQEGDFAAYGEANEQLKEALDRAEQASREPGGD